MTNARRREPPRSNRRRLFHFVREITMEAILFTGIQATGKTTLYRERFFRTHVRISLDLLRTRHREAAFLDACLATQQPFVVDNTNPARVDRARYITAARRAGFRVVSYYFSSQIGPALARNRERTGKERIPEPGVLGTYGRLEPPSRDEGFDAMFFVRMHESGFAVEEWRDEAR
ncbi:MAG: AAA family ATPase [Sandaracinaceae bacterium]|nr:AAA family ATPase [Sandaracinaceae bacterium]